MARHARHAEADIFGAIAAPTRRALLDLVAAGDRPVKSLSQAFSMTRPAVPQHLRILRDAGLVTERKVGRERYYRLQGERLRKVSTWVRRYERFWDERLAALGEHLERAP